jgi:hypothetical protein
MVTPLRAWVRSLVGASFFCSRRLVWGAQRSVLHVHHAKNKGASSGRTSSVHGRNQLVIQYGYSAAPI